MAKQFKIATYLKTLLRNLTHPNSLLNVDYDDKVIKEGEPAESILLAGASDNNKDETDLENEYGNIPGTMIMPHKRLLGWQHDIVFSSTDLDTVEWTAGAITLIDNTSYSIGAGNTGNMAAETFIYLDTEISTTTLQITTDNSEAVGLNKILIAVAENAAADEAEFMVFGSGNINIDGGKIRTNSITANEIAANTITAAEIFAGAITTTELSFTPLISAGTTAQIIATINASAEGVRIGADNIHIAGTTTFTAAWSGAANVGGLAEQDTVGAGDCDATVISGGKIITGLLTATNIQAGTLTVNAAVGVVVNDGGDIIFNSSTYPTGATYSQLIFNKTGVANEGWDIHFNATGGGGYQAGDLQFMPQSGNDSDTFRLGMATQACNLVVHGDVAATTFNGGALPTGTVTSVATSGAINGGTITTTGTISHSTSSGYKHLPSAGSTYQQLYNSATGTAAWSSRTYVGGNSGCYFERSGAGRINSVVDLTAAGSLHATGNVYTGGISGSAGSLNASLIHLGHSATSPSSHGEIRNYASGATDQFRGMPGDGSWLGSFDMSAA